MGGAWLAWLGGIFVLMTAAWFFAYAAQQGWVNPWMRVSTGWIIAALLIGLGEWASRRNMPWFGAGVTGTGLGVGYVATYAASPLLYGLIGTPATYAILSVVTAVGLLQAVRLDQLATAVLALLGGFMTLVLVRSDHPTAAGLLGYLLALNVGALGAGQLRRWRALRLLAWPGTAMLIAAWLSSAHRPGTELPASLSFLATLFVLYQLDMFSWRLRTPAETSRIIGMLSGLNCSAVLLAVWMLVSPDQVARIVGTAFFAVAGLQVILARALWMMSDGEQNRRVAISFYGQASMAAAVGLPIAFDRQLIGLGWAAQALTITWLVRHVRAVALRLKVPLLLLAGIVYIAIYFQDPFMTEGLLSARCWLAVVLCAAGAVSAWLFACWYRQSDWMLDRQLGEVCAALASAAAVIAGATLASSAPSFDLWVMMVAAVAAGLGLLSYKASVLRLPLLMSRTLLAAAVLVAVGAQGSIGTSALDSQPYVFGPVTCGLLLPTGLLLVVLYFWNAWLVRHAATTRHISGSLAECIAAAATAGLLLVLHNQLADNSPAYAVLAATGAALLLAMVARFWTTPAYWAWSAIIWTAAAGYWLLVATTTQRLGGMINIPHTWFYTWPFGNATFACILALSAAAWAIAVTLRKAEQLSDRGRRICLSGILLLVAYGVVHGVSFEVDRWFHYGASAGLVSLTYMELLTLIAVWAGFSLAYMLTSWRRMLQPLWWFSLAMGGLTALCLLFAGTLGARLHGETGGVAERAPLCESRPSGRPASGGDSGGRDPCRRPRTVDDQPSAAARPRCALDLRGLRSHSYPVIRDRPLVPVGRSCGRPGRQLHGNLHTDSRMAGCGAGVPADQRMAAP